MSTLWRGSPVPDTVSTCHGSAARLLRPVPPLSVTFPEMVEIRRGREVVIGPVRYGGFAQPTREHRGPDDRRRMALIDLLQKSEEGDFLRSVAEAVLQLLMDLSSEMVHALLPVFLVVTLGASVAAVGVIEGDLTSLRYSNN
jgi:hypothetical protein